MQTTPELNWPACVILFNGLTYYEFVFTDKFGRPMLLDFWCCYIYDWNGIFSLFVLWSSARYSAWEIFLRVDGIELTAVCVLPIFILRIPKLSCISCNFWKWYFFWFAAFLPLWLSSASVFLCWLMSVVLEFVLLRTELPFITLLEDSCCILRIFCKSFALAFERSSLLPCWRLEDDCMNWGILTEEAWFEMLKPTFSGRLELRKPYMVPYFVAAGLETSLYYPVPKLSMLLKVPIMGDGDTESCLWSSATMLHSLLVIDSNGCILFAICSLFALILKTVF